MAAALWAFLQTPAGGAIGALLAMAACCAIAWATFGGSCVEGYLQADQAEPAGDGFPDTVAALDDVDGVDLELLRERVDALLQAPPEFDARLLPVVDADALAAGWQPGDGIPSLQRAPASWEPLRVRDLEVESGSARAKALADSLRAFHAPAAAFAMRSTNGGERVST